MIIRSQDKSMITNFHQTTDIGATYVDEKRTEIIAFLSKGQTCLGIYSTEAKAIKVLDMIQDTYESGNEWLCVAGKVFQMPQDNEVNV